MLKEKNIKLKLRSSMQSGGNGDISGALQTIGAIGTIFQPNDPAVIAAYEQFKKYSPTLYDLVVASKRPITFEVQKAIRWIQDDINTGGERLNWFSNKFTLLLPDVIIPDPITMDNVYALIDKQINMYK